MLVISYVILNFLLYNYTVIKGDYCEDEINECMARPCLNGGTCSDAFNDFSCDCPPGYNGKRCEWDVGKFEIIYYFNFKVLTKQ